jgi:hypothetical protein
MSRHEPREKDAKALKEKRLAEALRRNLRRRKNPRAPDKDGGA